MSYLEDFDTITLEEIQAYEANKKTESLHLEFKTVKDASLTQGEDKKNVAVAMSGFSNSAGGVIVWGVVARKDEEDIDRVTGLQPIKRIEQFVARLNALTGDAVDPYVSGIRHRGIQMEDGSGFAITLVPESDTGPHMAKFGENRYYKRNGDSFCKMEHFDIADMFGRRRRPKLKVFHSIKAKGSQLTIHLGIRNTGRATARAPFLSFTCAGPVQRSNYGLDGNMNEGLPLLRGAVTAYTYSYAGGMDFALHPGMSHAVAALTLVGGQREFPSEDVIVHYLLACEDYPLEKGSFTIPNKELLY